MSHPPQLRVFLDANVLYSASIGGIVSTLWTRRDITLVTSEYAAQEATENLLENSEGSAASERLNQLLETVELVPHQFGAMLFGTLDLRDPDDIPILAAAIEARCTHLLTGDRKHFGHLMGRAIEGVVVMTPGMFAQTHPSQK